MGPTTPPANDSRRELFSMMPLEPSRDRGDAIDAPSKAQARATAALKAEAAHRIAWLRERREEIEPLHEASLEEAGLRALVGEGRGSSLGLLRLENSLDLALHRALKRIDALRKQGRISPPRSTQVPEPAKACTKCENEPQKGRPKAPEPARSTALIDREGPGPAFSLESPGEKACSNSFSPSIGKGLSPTRARRLLERARTAGRGRHRR
jgi:hypothetical protein